MIEPFDLKSLAQHRKRRQLKTAARKASKQNNNINLTGKPDDKAHFNFYNEKKENVPLKKLRCLLKRSIVNNTEQAETSSMQSHKVKYLYFCIYNFIFVSTRGSLSLSLQFFIPLAEKNQKIDSLNEFSNIPIKNEDVDLMAIDNWLENGNEKTASEDDFEINNGCEFIDFLVNKNPLNIEITFENSSEHD